MCLRTICPRILFVLCFVNILPVSAQDDPNSVSLPSVNNIFTSNSSFNVSLYTGSPVIKVPLFELVSKDFKIPIQLNYTGAKGIRVQDFANYTGLGWTLTGAGNVSRIVRGIPDEEIFGYIGPIGYGYGKTLNTAGPSGITGDMLQKVGTGQADGEPDIFHVSTPFFDFQFVFDENGKPVFPNNSGFKITHNLYNNYSYSNSYFIISDDQGNQYFFGSTPNSKEQATSKLYDVSKPYTSSWYLDKIVTYNGGDIITFNYISGSDYSLNHYSWSVAKYTGSTCTISDGSPVSVTQTTTYNAPKYLSSIVSSLGEVDFSYLPDRRDVVNSNRLTSMVVYPFMPGTVTKGNSIRNYQFKYSYFGDPSADPNVLRLRLDTIFLSSGSSVVTYKTFGYNVTNNLPNRNSVEFDYWGYYNTNISGTALVPAANKNPDLNRVQANLLTSISDPTGETDKIFYESNDFYDAASSQDKKCGGVRVSKLSKTTLIGDNIFTQYIYKDSLNRSSGQVYNSNYLNFKKHIFVFFVVEPPCYIMGDITTSESVYNAFDLNGNSVGYSVVKILDQNGGYEIDKFTNFSDFPDVFLYATNGSGYSYQDSRQLSAATSYAYKRGLLTKKTLYKANNDKISETVNTYASQSALSQKSLSLKSNCLAIVYGTTASNWVYGLYYANNENYLLAKSQEILYDQNNQTIFSQTTSNFTYASNKRLIQKIDFLDSKGQTRTKTTYHADDTGIPDATQPELDAISVMLQNNRTNVAIHSIDNTNVSINTTHYSYGKFIDNNYAAKTFLISETNYLNNSASRKQVQYFYDVNKSTQTAHGRTNGTKDAVIFGYNNSYIKAKIRNATSYVNYITSQGIQYANLNVPGGVSGTYYVNFTSNYPGTVTINLLAGSWLGGSGTITLSGSASFGSYSGVICRSNQVNACGNPASVVFNNVPAGTYSVSFNVFTNTVPSGNTVSIQVAYQGYQLTYSGLTEFYIEDFEEMAGAATATPHTGLNYWGSNFTVSYVIPNSRSYTIQWWNYANGIWNFNQQAYTGSMVLTGPVDDIRIFPKDGEIVSYSYLPLLGINSTTDNSGSSTKFEYDPLGRLVLVRNSDNNIIKKVDYQYQTLLTPVTNGVQFQTFTRNNCTPPNIGGPYTYTVPAGRYSSYISLDDANQQALSDISANGQNNANTYGSCTAPSNVTIKSTNWIALSGFKAVYTNVSTGVQTTFNIPSTSGLQTLGTLAPGVYNLTISKTGNTLTWIFVACNTGYKTGTSATFNNITVSASDCNAIQIDSVN